MGRTTVASPGMKGFDVNARVGPQAATSLAAHGYAFAVRYVPRLEATECVANDLSAEEIADLHAAGIAVMPVQHVESETSWVPTADKGAEYGRCAARAAQRCGIPGGVTLWLDLEGVAADEHDTYLVQAADVIAYCQAWYHAVTGVGYRAGLYVGWHCGLSARELHECLSFDRYWSSYNLNADELPAVRGVCMKQRLATHDEFTAWLELDIDVIEPDALGGLPMLYAPGNG